MSLKKFIEELNGSRVEGELIKSVLYSLLTSALILGILYYFSFRNISGFMEDYGLFLFLAAASFAFIIPTVHHVRAYKEMNCMSGMMIGMTCGMIAGFLPGFYLAATNGMFYGGFFGVAIGMAFGIANGKCCGIMGIMEGIMAGFMGGLMGAMTAFMLLNDHLQAASFLVFGISVFLILGLHYMIFKETKDIERQRKENYWLTILLTIALTLITTMMAVYGPKGGIFS